jgi:hypothetical protein
MTSLLG